MGLSYLDQIDKTPRLMKNLRREIRYSNSISLDRGLTLSQERCLRFVEARHLPLPMPRVFTLPISQVRKSMLRAGRPSAQGHAATGPELGLGRAAPRNPAGMAGNGQSFPNAFYKINNQLPEGGEKSLAPPCCMDG